jgi:hypothetical protein
METTEQETQSVQYHPLDVTRLVKGQVLSIAELEPIIRLKHPDERWGLRLLRLKKNIDTLRARLGLQLLTMRNDHDTLVICDDANAASYNRSMVKRGVRRVRRAAARNIAVDVSKLTDEDRKAHERAIQRQAMLLAAIRVAGHKQPSALTSGGRVTPKMVTAQ